MVARYGRQSVNEVLDWPQSRFRAFHAAIVRLIERENEPAPG